MTKEMKEILDELSAIETRSAEIRSLANEADEAALDAMMEETQKNSERKSALLARKAEIEAEEAEARAVIDGKTEVTEVTGKKEEKMTLNEVRSSEAYVNAYAEYIKTGDDTEVRSLLTDLVSGGKVPTPTMVSDAIGHAWENTQILRRLTKVNVPGSLKVPYEASATGAVVHTEGAAAPTEEALVLATVELKPEMLKKWITISDEVMALKGEAFLNYINAEMTQRIFEAADAKAVNAITASSLTASVTHALDASAIFAGLASLSDEATNPVAIMSKATYFNTFMALTDTTGRPIYNVVPENGKPTYYINGVEVIFSSAAGANVIIGDLDGMMCNLPEGEGIKFINDPYSLAERDLVKIVARLYMAVDVVKPGRFVKVAASA